MCCTSVRRFAQATFGVALLAPGALPATARDGPTRPVRLIVPFGSGGSADASGRFLAQRLQGVFGQSFAVRNRLGGGAVIGTDAVDKSAPGGHTLLVRSNPDPATESLLRNERCQLMRDFVAGAPGNAPDLVPVARAGCPAKRLAAAASPNPIGGTQVTGIPCTEGVAPVAELPQRLQLATTYTVVVAAQAAEPGLAARPVALMTGDAAAGLRAGSGCEGVAAARSDRAGPRRCIRRPHPG